MMDTTIIAAIIGATGAIIAAVIAVIMPRLKRNRKSSEVYNHYFRKANVFRLGFESGMLDFLEGLRVNEMWSAIGNKGIEIQRERINTLASALGIKELPGEPNSLLKSLSDHLISEPLYIRRTYDIGFNIAVGFGIGIVMQVAAQPGRRKEVEQMAWNVLKKNESVLQDAELAQDFLNPIRRVWTKFSRNISNGDNDIGEMTKTIRKSVEDLAVDIERTK